MLVPSGVVTDTPTLPAERAGVVTVMLVAVFAVMTPAVLPNSTRVAPSKLVPVMTTLVPPTVVPVIGATCDSNGGRARAKTATFGFVVVPAPV